MVVHYTRLLTAILLLLSVSSSAYAQLRAPWGARPFDEEEPPRRHSIVTVWADALESLSHPNPLLRWHAARLSADYAQAFENDELTRAWMRERDLRVRVALKRTLIQLGQGDDLVRFSSTNPSSCAQVRTRVRGDETRPVAELLSLLELAKSQEVRTYLAFELALALRQLKTANSRTTGLQALRAHANPRNLLLLRGVARDQTVIKELTKQIKSAEVSERREAVDAIAALDNPNHMSLLKSALARETQPDVLRALLHALRRAKVAVSSADLVGVEQRIDRHPVPHTAEADASLMAFEVEFTRTALAVAKPHQLLYERAQRQIRSWLSPTSPLAGLAIFLMGFDQVPIYSVAPYVDDTRAHVRAAAVRAITRQLSAKHPLRTWLALEAIDSRTFEQLQPEAKAPQIGPPVPVLLLSNEPLLVAWERGHELVVPSSTSVLFVSDAPGTADYCWPERTWLSLEEQIRDL